MSDERSTFEVTRARLEDIVTQVRRKDVSLEQSLDLLEEAVRLVNQCNELIDQTSFRPATTEVEADGAEASAAPGSGVVVEVAEVVAVGDDGAVGVLEVAVAADAGEPNDQWGSVDAWSDDETPAEAGVPDETDDGASETGPVEVEDDERE